MARLPQPGADDGTWGDILNGYLQVSLDGNGLINPGTVTESQLASAVQTKLNNVGTVADGSITTAKVADGAIAQAKLSGSVQSQLSNIGTVNDGAVTTAKLADGAVTNATLADGTISETKLDTATQAKLDATAPVTSVNTKTGAVILDKIDIGLGNIDNTSDANKPVSSATQTALNAKATTASLATVATSGSYTDLTNQPTIPTVSDATTSTKGIIQLAGDLAGTAAAPTVPGLAGKEPTIAAGTTAQYWRGDKSWQALDKTAVGLANVDNTSDLNKPISTATQTALNNKADSSAIVGSNVFVYNAYADAPALPVNTVVISKTGS